MSGWIAVAVGVIVVLVLGLWIRYGLRVVAEANEVKASLLEELHGRKVTLALEQSKAAALDFTGRLDATNARRGSVVLTTKGKPRHVPLGQIRFIGHGGKEWGPL